MMTLTAKSAAIAIVFVAASGCQGSDTDDIRTGVLIGGGGASPGPIEGLSFESGSLSGVTDSHGAFQYYQGAQVTFALGGLAFEPTLGAPAVSPFQLANGSRCAVNDALATVLQLLQSVDTDSDPSNGLQMPDVPTAADRRRAAGLGAAELQDVVSQLRPGAQVIDRAVALDRFIRCIDDEQWGEAPSDVFEVPELVARTQGVATDGSSWYFSSAGRLERTDLGYQTQADNRLPIPQDIYALGGNHIGDIDYHAGLVYAPIEDGPEFQHPYVVTYDATTLEATGDRWLLPQAQQTQGVPWIAIDEARGVAYSADWDPVDALHVYALDDMSPAGLIPLTPALGRIQGAKVYGGVLYAASDDAEKTVYKIDLDTGIVIKLFSFGTTESELEGLALIGPPQSVRMRVLNVVVPTVVFEARERTRGPVRDLVCP